MSAPGIGGPAQDPSGTPRDAVEAAGAALELELLAEVEEMAVRLAVGAGELARQGRAGGLQISTKTTDTDVVTQMDTRCEAYLRENIAAARPQDGVLGEEGGADAAAGYGLTWVVDPIDGTVNYLYGSAEYAVSVAAVVGDPSVPGAWRPVAGAVAQPEAGRVFHARLGGGARVSVVRDGHVADPNPLRVNPVQRLDLTLLGTGFAYDRDDRRRQAEALLRILPQVRDIRRGGSAALDLCSVAAGRLDAYYERGVHAWDVAAGWLVAAEAGAVVGGVDGVRPARTGIIAAAPGVHGQVRELVRRATADPV